MIESWEILGNSSADADIVGSAFNSSVIIKANSSGTIRIKANWQTGDGGPS